MYFVVNKIQFNSTVFIIASWCIFYLCRYILQRWCKVVEAVIVASSFAIVSFLLIVTLDHQCTPQSSLFSEHHIEVTYETLLLFF